MSMKLLKPVTSPEAIQTMKRAIIDNDLSRMTDGEKLRFYVSVCESAGLNPLMQPFKYLKLSGSLCLYATKTCAEQLRGIHGISIQSPLREWEKDGIYYVEATATNREGRTDVDRGAVPIKGLSGDRLANATKKCVTQAKRRVTLSIAGLGFLLDQTEVEQVPGEIIDLPDAMPTAENTPGTDWSTTAAGTQTRPQASGLAEMLNQKMAAARRCLDSGLLEEMEIASGHSDAVAVNNLKRWGGSPWNNGKDKKRTNGAVALRALRAVKGSTLTLRDDDPELRGAVALRDDVMGKRVPTQGGDGMDRWIMFVETWMGVDPPTNFVGEGDRENPDHAITEGEAKRMRDGEIVEGGES